MHLWLGLIKETIAMYQLINLTPIPAAVSTVPVSFKAEKKLSQKCNSRLSLQNGLMATVVAGTANSSRDCLSQSPTLLYYFILHLLYIIVAQYHMQFTYLLV